MTSLATGVCLTVKVTPRASSDGLVGVEAAWLRVRLRAPPVDGKANAALCRWLAKTLGISRREIALISGESGRLKRLHIVGLNAAQVRERLAC